jgi:hypothetical protein
VKLLVVGRDSWLLTGSFLDSGVVKKFGRDEPKQEVQALSPQEPRSLCGECGWRSVCAEGRIWDVHNVHTLGFGFSRTDAGLGRIAEVSATSQCFQGSESGSSPTSGTCFPCSGACRPLSVHKLFT